MKFARGGRSLERESPTSRHDCVTGPSPVAIGAKGPCRLPGQQQAWNTSANVEYYVHGMRLTKTETTLKASFSTRREGPRTVDCQRALRLFPA